MANFHLNQKEDVIQQSQKISIQRNVDIGLNPVSFCMYSPRLSGMSKTL